MASYDNDWCGIGHPNHPANERREPGVILLSCDGCDDLIPENEAIEDGDWCWCTQCWGEVCEEIKTKAPELTEAIQ